ncbi:acyltransferase family protein [Wenxinia marina]|uniref:acyltransferase family protein n=1 Tax=Wenxinia marina TaxID=390641 RepID=UPI0004778333|nr:acyltransferase family protein [Wenxinia marina]
MKYRPDVDGLRAVAVLAVVLYHAGLLGWSGGFIGVDVFFVISGYLITGIIYRESIQNRFSFIDFYDRRLRRIMPALLCVVLFVLAGASLLFLPREMRVLPGQVIGAVTFVANIVLWRQSGYFAPAADELPLLHIWSLGVEEQFYIFAPVLIIGILRWAPRLLIPFVVIATILSFALSVVFSSRMPDASFYLLPTRAWELAAGSLVSLAVLPRPSNRVVRELATVAGLALIVGGVVFIGPEMAFPGAIAAVPVIGSVLVILCGDGTKAGAALAWRPVRGLGLISYSLYLWHWPLIVFADYGGWLEGRLSAVLVVLISIVIAWLSWRFVERPFRDRTRVRRSGVFYGSAAGVLVAVTLAGWIQTTDGWPTRWSDTILRFAAAGEDVSPARDRCHRMSGLGDIAESCVLGSGVPTTAVWSDSHGVELAYGLSEYVPVQQISYTSCAPALGMDRIRSFQCREHNDLVLAYLLDPASDIDTVILSAWFEDVLEKDGFRGGFADTVDRLTEAGLRVIVVSQLPNPGYLVPIHLARGGDVSFAFDEFAERHAAITAYLETLATPLIFDPAPLICDEACELLVDGAPVIFDRHHPSMSMATVIAESLVERYDLKP